MSYLEIMGWLLAPDGLFSCSLFGLKAFLVDENSGDEKYGSNRQNEEKSGIH